MFNENIRKISVFLLISFSIIINSFCLSMPKVTPFQKVEINKQTSVIYFYSTNSAFYIWTKDIDLNQLKLEAQMEQNMFKSPLYHIKEDFTISNIYYYPLVIDNSMLTNGNISISYLTRLSNDSNLYFGTKSITVKMGKVYYVKMYVYDGFNFEIVDEDIALADGINNKITIKKE